MNKSKTPTDAQLFALITYANGNGRTWKSKLNDDWMNGRTVGELQQVRNQFGPTWLARFKLPAVEMAATGDNKHPLRAEIAHEHQWDDRGFCFICKADSYA